MREYTFLLKTGFRTEHYKVHTLKQGLRKAKRDYGVEMLTGQYQTCSDKAFVMSGWLPVDIQKEKAGIA